MKFTFSFFKEWNLFLESRYRVYVEIDKLNKYFNFNKFELNAYFYWYYLLTIIVKNVTTEINTNEMLHKISKEFIWNSNKIRYTSYVKTSYVKHILNGIHVLLIFKTRRTITNVVWFVLLLFFERSRVTISVDEFFWNYYQFFKVEGLVLEKLQKQIKSSLRDSFFSAIFFSS